MCVYGDFLALSRFFSLPLSHSCQQHLMPAPVAAAYFHDEIMREQRQNQNDPNTTTNIAYPRVTVVASHEGQVGRATHFRSALQRLSGGQPIELAVLSKNKLLPGETHYTPTLVGHVKGRRCILVDDICNTGTTLVSNIQVSGVGVVCWSVSVSCILVHDSRRYLSWCFFCFQTTTISIHSFIHSSIHPSIICTTTDAPQRRCRVHSRMGHTWNFRYDIRCTGTFAGPQGTQISID